MKTTKTLLLFCLLSVAAFAVEPVEKLIYIQADYPADTDAFKYVQVLLRMGWTVKHQACAEGTYDRRSILITLSPPKTP